jgi:hypothetical protein
MTSLVSRTSSRDGRTTTLQRGRAIHSIDWLSSINTPLSTLGVVLTGGVVVVGAKLAVYGGGVLFMGDNDWKRASC